MIWFFVGMLVASVIADFQWTRREVVLLCDRIDRIGTRSAIFSAMKERRYEARMDKAFTAFERERKRARLTDAQRLTDSGV